MCSIHGIIAMIVGHKHIVPKVNHFTAAASESPPSLPLAITLHITRDHSNY